MADTWRTFIAIDPGKALRAEIDELQSRLQNKTGPGIRWVKPEQVHLTLKFLGDVPLANIEPLAAAVRSACSAAKTFALTIEGSGCFPSFRKPSVVWLGLSGELPVLHSLQQQIEKNTRELSGHDEKRQFSPHLTIGRVKARLSREQQRIGSVIQATKVAELGKLTVSEVLLMRSETLPAGPVYTTIARAALGGSG